MILILEIELTAFFVSFSSFIFKGLSIVHGLLIVVFISQRDVVEIFNAIHPHFLTILKSLISQIYVKGLRLYTLCLNPFNYAFLNCLVSFDS